MSSLAPIPIAAAGTGSSKFDTDVVIIGAGPVGLTAALTLQRFGIDFRIVDRNPGPVQHSNALGVAVRTLEVLEMLGLKQQFSKAGYPVDHGQFRTFGKFLGRLSFNSVDSPYRGMHAIPQNVTESLLNDALLERGGEILRNHEATAIQQDESGVIITARLHDGTPQTIRARYLIGCEGSNSITRQTCGIEFVGERYESWVFLQTDAVLKWTYPVGDMYAFLHENMAFLAFPYNLNGRARIICAIPDTNPEDKSLPTLAEMQQHARRAADPAAELSEPTWFSRFRTQHRIAKTYRDGRCFLAGDAAHVHPPIGGQGMNTGMQDAFNLGWKLALVLRAQGPETLLDTYNSERRPIAEDLIHGVDRAFHAIFGQNELWHATVRTLGPIAANLGVVQRRISNMLAEINITYPPSPLVASSEAGHRAADAPLVNLKTFKTTHLFELYDCSRYTLLYFSGSGDSAKQARSWQDLQKLLPKLAAYPPLLQVAALAADPEQCPQYVTESEQITPLADRGLVAHNKYGAGAGAHLILVRPDGYTAFAQKFSDNAAADLVAFLSRIITI
jgi:2-polyprenyl-6-methoxyphenol hydroxylase-like FAD-dependent oxidoreductase